ncbi:type VI secretion system accessory protein TagJ [Snodgrassella alvi]|jgi:type VI secretion system protein ImpE|nr:type VI secretion system accessory protein TagJ [Snodgrassella alvi]
MIINRSNERSLTLQQWMADRPLTAVMQETEQQIKLNPTDPVQRWLLFQLLCLQGNWQRALKQLQTCAQMQSGFEQEAHAYRGLIACEMYRQECFAGRKRPGFIQQQPAWVDQLLDAIGQNQLGDETKADEIRETALGSAEDVSGTAEPGGAFAWIADSDTWLGSTIEVVIGGIYTWLPFEQIRSISSEPPKTILDLLWKPAQLTLDDKSEHHAFLLARCCGSESAGEALMLCRETIWQEHGRTSVRALGQKTWQTDQGDVGILEITSCTFETDREAMHG